MKQFETKMAHKWCQEKHIFICDSSQPRLGRTHHSHPCNIFCTWKQKLHWNGTNFLEHFNENPKIVNLWISVFCRLITFIWIQIQEFSRETL